MCIFTFLLGAGIVFALEPVNEERVTLQLRLKTRCCDLDKGIRR